MTIDTTKKVVEQVLKENPKARNNDFLLTILVYIRMGYAKKLPLGVMINYKNLEFAPAWETITRCRRELQHNEGKFQPDQETMRIRNQREYDLHERYSKAAKFNEYPNGWMA